MTRRPPKLVPEGEAGAGEALAPRKSPPNPLIGAKSPPPTPSGNPPRVVTPETVPARPTGATVEDPYMAEKSFLSARTRIAEGTIPPRESPAAKFAVLAGQGVRAISMNTVKIPLDCPVNRVTGAARQMHVELIHVNHSPEALWLRIRTLELRGASPE